MNTSGKYGFLSTVLAFFTCFCLGSGYILTEPLWVDPGSVLNIFLFAGLAFLYHKAFFPFAKRRFCVSLFFGFLMGYMILLGAGYARDVQITTGVLNFIVAVTALALIFSAFLNLLLLVLPSVAGYQDALTKGLYEKLYGKAGMSGRPCGFMVYMVIYLFGGVLLFITFLAVCPGIYSYDASVQVLQFFGNKPVTTHHPLLHTLFLCGSLKAGNLLFGSYQAGMAIHSVLQAAVLNAVFSYVIWRMLKKQRPALLVIFTVLYFMVNPYMQIFLFVTTKDVLFGASFLLLFIFALDFFCDREKFFHSRWLQARFLLTALLVCFLRNQGIYVFLLFAVIALVYLFFISKKRIGRWLMLTVLTAGCYLVVSGPLFGAFGVESGDSREILSVPMQQLARAYHEAPEQLTPEELSYIRELIPPEYLDQYVSVNADPVKSGFQTEVMKKDIGKFFKTWLSIGMKTPLIYADSFFMGNWGYWYPEETQYWINYIIFDGAFMDEEFNVLNIRRNSRFPEYGEYLRAISLTPEFETIPVISVLLNQAFPFWMMLIAAAAVICYKKYRFLIPMTLLLGYWGTLLLGPVTSVRYAFPLMICIPSLLCLLSDAAASPDNG